jgi:hypothetical protein
MLNIFFIDFGELTNIKFGSCNAVRKLRLSHDRDVATVGLEKKKTPQSRSRDTYVSKEKGAWVRVCAPMSRYG